MQVECNGITLYYKKSGSGPPLLLLHGNGETHAIFNELVTKLNRDRTVYAIDSRNHGQSTRKVATSYHAMRDDVAAFIAALQLKDVTILGFSDGAIIGLMLGLSQQPQLKQLLLLGLNLAPADFKPAVRAMLQLEYRQTQNPLTLLMLEEPQLELRDLTVMTVPTLIVAGDNDVCEPVFFERVTAALPTAQLLILPGETHSSYIEHTDRLYPYLHPYLH